ncbi:MAG: ChaN family lipoprotein [Hyphomicrobiaceae bacterium]
MIRAVIALAIGAAPLLAVPPGELRAQTACPRPTIALAPAEQWDPARGGHPLVGTVLKGAEPLAPAVGDACAAAPIEQLRQAITAHLQEGGVVLLGEMHDNGLQHALRAELLRAAAAALTEGGRQRPPALVFEHIRTDQAAALEQRAGSNSESARDLLERLDWKNSGWPPAELFLPIFEVAVAGRLPILPGHPSRAEVRDVSRRGLAALPADTVARLGLDQPLPDALASALLDELEASHCGLMPRTAFTNMALAQRYRDAHLAAALMEAADKHGSAILLAGNGHVRTDRGVPWDLARMAPKRKVLSVLLSEVMDGRTDTTAYVMRDPSGKPAADFVVLTPRAARPDPCEAMRAHFKKQ